MTPPYLPFPKAPDVETATHEQLGRWLRFLPSPMFTDESRVLDRILTRFEGMGGWNPALSKRVGHSPQTQPPARRDYDYFDDDD